MLPVGLEGIYEMSSQLSGWKDTVQFLYLPLSQERLSAVEASVTAPVPTAHCNTNGDVGWPRPSLPREAVGPGVGMVTEPGETTS